MFFFARNEVEEMRMKVMKEREKYQMSTQSYGESLSAIPLLTVKYSVSNLNPNLGA